MKLIPYKTYVEILDKCDKVVDDGIFIGFSENGENVLVMGKHDKKVYRVRSVPTHLVMFNKTNTDRR